MPRNLINKSISNSLFAGVTSWLLAVWLISATAAAQGIQLELGERVNRFERHREIRRAMSRPLTIQADDTTLGVLVEKIEDELSVRIELIEAELELVGLSKDTPLQVNLQQQSFLTVLQPLDLTYEIFDERVVILTESGCRDYDNIEVFNVTRLVDPTTRKRVARSSRIEPWSIPIARTITEHIAPDTWDRLGGPGQMQVVLLQGETLLIVHQYDYVLRQLEDFLDHIDGELKNLP